MFHFKGIARVMLPYLKSMHAHGGAAQKSSVGRSASEGVALLSSQPHVRACSASSYWQSKPPLRSPEPQPTPKRRRPETYVSRHFRLEAGDVENFLRRHQWKFRCTGEHAIVEECPFCHSTKGLHENMWKLHILRKSGVYYCHRCKAKGTWFDLRKHVGYEQEFQNPFGEVMTADRKDASPKTEVVPDTSLQLRYVRDLWSVHDAARRYLTESRGLREDVLKKYGVGAAHFPVMVAGGWKKQLCITFPMYDGDGQLVRHKVRSIETKCGMRLDPKGGGWGFFGLDVIPTESEQVMITEGELDALSVYQATGRPAISLPNGASSLPVSLLPSLERFKKIVLWMDNDAPGQDGAQQFSKKLGLQRCVSIKGSSMDSFEGSEPCKDANDALRQGKDLAAIIKQAKAVPHEGLLTFADIREEVRHEVENKDTISGMRCSSLPRFNDLLGGHRRGELSIYSGHTGVGKTTLLSQLALDYCMQGVPTLWGSFEIGNPRLVSRILRQFYGAHCSGPTNGPQLMENFDVWADRFEELPMYFMRYHGSNAIDRVVEAMEYANYVYDCSHVVLDNLQFLTSGQAYGNDKFAVLDHAISQIRSFCTSKNVHVSLVVHPRKEEDEVKIQTSSVFGSAKATQEADNVIILQQGPILDVRKNRFDGSLGAVSLHFDRKRLLFSQKDNQGASWAGRTLVAKSEDFVRSNIGNRYGDRIDRASRTKAKVASIDSQTVGPHSSKPKQRRRKQSADATGALSENTRSADLWNRKTAGARKSRVEQYVSSGSD